MSDTVQSAAARLAALRFLERVQLGDLERTQRWISDAERRLSEAQARQEREAQPPPEWIVQRGVGSGPATVHTMLGAYSEVCWGLRVDHVRIRPVSREQAMRAITEEGVVPCERCRPDTALGLL
ncbi:DUF6233 domain-containing protein [Streptomyces sp. NPDC051320]|uniref:DUF6233 domain-containing protein n=1 Tax=Streptomyces sp. NPDC051320 TaxID=3154644 RepID=UPI003421D991